MKLTEAINKRTSVRDFSNKPVKFEAILEAIDAADRAPFAGNLNNLKFVIVEKKESKNLIAEFAQQYWINDAQWVVVVCSELRKLEELYADRAQMYSRQQAGAAIENMLLMLTKQGIGACWVGAFSEHEIKNKLKIPDTWSIEALIPIGYQKAKEKKPARKAQLENKIFWDQWNQSKKPMKYPHKDPMTRS